MKTRNLVILASILLLASWMILVLSGINAAYFLEVNSAKMVGTHPQSWISFITEDGRLITGLLHIEWNLLPLYVLYWAPILSVLMAHKSNNIQYIVIIIITVLLLLDIRQLLMFEGGDRKGCEFCSILWLIHSSAGAVALVVVILAGLSRIVRKKGNSNL